MIPLISKVTDLARESDRRLCELAVKGQAVTDELGLNHVAIYAVGSYARGDAHQHSDLDLFFVSTGEEPVTNLKRIDLFSRLSELVRQASLEEFSNDGQFLNVHQVRDLFDHLGSPSDDHFNTSTARVLSLIESKPFANPKALQEIRERVAESYLRDYHDHEAEFLPLFVVNDIIRYWRHLCLAWEFRRHIRDDNEWMKAKHALRNLKLKYYRLTSCYSAVAFLAAFRDQFKEEQLLELADLSPFERIARVVEFVDGERLPDCFESIQEKYCDFVDFAGNEKQEVLTYLSVKEHRKEQFELAREYGKHFYELFYGVMKDHQMLRYLLI